MPKFRITVNLDIPAESPDKATANVGDFLSCVTVGGKQLEYTIVEIMPAWFVRPQED